MKLLLFVLVLGTVLLSLLPAPASGQVNLIYPVPVGSDTGGAGCVPKWVWSDGACWYVVGTFPPVFRLPQNGDKASVVIVNSFVLDISSANLGSLDINSANLASGATFVQPNVTLTTASEGVSGFVGYNQAGGTNNAGAFTLSGAYTLQAGTLSALTEAIDQVNFGDPSKGGLGNSPGVLTQSDGKNTVSGTLTLGANPLINNGEYNLNGGQLSAANEIVGNGGTGFFNQNGGTNTISGQLTLGSKAGSGSNGFSVDNTYTLSGGNLSAATVVVGDAGRGTFTQTGGTNKVSGQLTLGNQAGGSGEYDLRATAALEAGTEIFGSGGGTYNQTGGTNTVDGDLTAAQNSFGSYNLSGSNALLKVRGDENLGVEDGSRIQFVQGGGNNQIVGNLNLGGNPSLNPSTSTGRGSYELDGGLVSVGGSEVIATNGNFVQTGGINNPNRLILQGTYELNGPGVLATTNEMIGRPLLLTGQANFIQRGGTNTTGTLTLGDRGNYELIDGTLTASEIVNTCSGLCSPTLFSQRGGFFDYVGGNLNANFNNEADGTFRISGRGTRVVNGSLTNTGTVEVTADRVVFSNVTLTSGVFKADPTAVEFQNLTVGAAGVIIGAAGDVFSITGNFQNLSTQNTLWDTSSSVLDFTGGGSHIFDLAGKNGVGFSNDFAWGSLVLDPGNTLNLALGSGDALYAFILQGLIISGNTVTNIDGTPGLFLYYDAADNPSLSGNYNLTGGGELIAVNSTLPQTPEPSTWLLMASGLSSLIARRTCRRK